MLHKCANIACLNLFRSISRGKLFHVEQPTRRRLTTTRKHKTLPRLEYFWLCDECSPFFTLMFSENQGLIACPLIPQVSQRIESGHATARNDASAAEVGSCTTS